MDEDLTNAGIYDTRENFSEPQMVQVCLNQDRYIPGDELRISVTLTRHESVQLLSIRCFGYCRLPANASKELPDRSKYAFKDKPGTPVIPDDSILLWVTPNFPVHVDFNRDRDGLTKLFIPYFLPPSIRGGLFEICHFAEISILIKGEFEMRTKRIPLSIASFDGMPKNLCPAIGDGFEQFDFNVAPSHQSTPHGRRASGFEALDLVKHKVTRRLASGFFRSRKTFKISFNNQHAVEISILGEWIGDHLSVEDGTTVTAQFRFDHSNVSVKRICSRVVRKETIKSKEENWLETTVFHTNPLTINPYLVEANQAIAVPPQVCPSFTSELVGVSYHIDFELRALDATTNVPLENVVWTLPVLVQSSMEAETASTAAVPCNPYDDEQDHIVMSQRDSEIFQVRQRSHINPGCMRFTIYS
jgi:hypothetical protein